MTEENSTIWVLVEKEEFIESSIIDGERSGEDTGGGYDCPPSVISDRVSRLFTKKRIPLDAQALKTQMNGLMQVVGDLFTQAEQNNGMCLDEVTLSVEVNAEGQIGLAGNGGKLGNTGGITMKFTRLPR
ncbi:hypothetical protein H6F95_18860 [Cyanobacteria bacterium FACHB-471]|nr:hypothetical protein [Cyanobacteria bacterium FACHB-471]